jgi:acyl dehydratase
MARTRAPLDETFTTKVAGYPIVFAHGMLTNGHDRQNAGRLRRDARLTKYGFRFTNQVWPGDTLNATALPPKSAAAW